MQLAASSKQFVLGMKKKEAKWKSDGMPTSGICNSVQFACTFRTSCIWMQWTEWNGDLLGKFKALKFKPPDEMTKIEANAMLDEKAARKQKDQ